MVNRQFVAKALNALWVADMTYVPTWVGFIYLPMVLEVWSRRVVGWSIGKTTTAELILAALVCCRRNTFRDSLDLLQD